MTVANTAGAPSSQFKNWKSIEWNTVTKEVKRLQMRIAKASREGRHGKVKSLQWLLTHSHYAKLLAVKRVVENRGKKTPGVDKVTWDSPGKKMQAVKMLQRRGYQPSPLRRIYIPKKNGSRRPLSIPTMLDRAQQALHLLALAPIAETTADRNSYGFRYARSCADAIEQCFKCLAQKGSAKWVLEGDIKACFDGISHEWLLKNIPMDKQMLQKWLTAGVVYKGTLYPTEAGTPQGGIASPCLANMALDGLEAVIKRAVPDKSRVNFIRYADDFVVTGTSRELLEGLVKPAIEEFLAKRALVLSQEKTKITHIDDGFDFLSQNVRKYKGKLLITPSKDAISSFLRTTKGIIKSHRGAKTEVLIRKLSAVNRGWANYHCHVVSHKTFGYVSHRIFEYLWSWALNRHNNKRRVWIKRKYFPALGTRQWVFSCQVRRDNKAERLILFLPNNMPIKRHIKIRAVAHPFDSEFSEYLYKRRFVRFRTREA